MFPAYNYLMRHHTTWIICLLLTACAEKAQDTGEHPVPATAISVAAETELLRLTLPPSSRQRLGIETVPARQETRIAYRQLSGEVVVPPLVADGVPTNSSTNFQLLAAQQVQADADLASAKAGQQLAQIALSRAEALILEEAGSQRAIDEATAVLATAEAALHAAQRRRNLLGLSVETMGQQQEWWIRVAVFSSDLDALRLDPRIRVGPLSGRAPSIDARPVIAPPSANPIAGTVDVYYALQDSDTNFLVGQRVAVEVPVASQTTGIAIPSAAILRDVYGGEWVYQQTGEGSYIRRRIEVAQESNGYALLSRGLAPGDDIVTSGAAELFGIEFGAAH
jgi:multidrug efflux system membrane fusion protein